jgi:hypothetical protein
MLKIKNILPVFVVLLFLGIASTAFAQVSCSVASTPVSRDSATGLTEPAGDITFSCNQAAGATASTAGATVTVTYGVPITNDTSTPSIGQGYGATKTVSVVGGGGTGCFTTPTSVTVSNQAGSVVIALPAIGVTPSAPTLCNFTLTGVLLGLSGSSATSVVATVSVSPGNNLLITAGQTTPTVVTSVLAAVTAATVKPAGGPPATGGPGIVPTTGASSSFSPNFQISVTENYIDMFRDKANFNGGAASNGVQLVYTFAGIPTGASLGTASTPCTASFVTGFPAAPDGTVTLTGGAGNGTITAAAPTVTVEVSSLAATALTSIDTINLQCTAFSNGTATLPLSPGSITATVTLGPVGTAFSSSNQVLNNPTTTGQIPRYTGPSFGPLTVINIIPLTTHMIMPFVSVGNGFDTGFSIANTSADPYGPKGGGATPLAGPVTVAFFPANAAAFCVSTASGAAPVNGITSCSTFTGGAGLTSGAINAGASWTFLLSQVVSGTTGAPTVFSGYAFAIANFPFGHPTVFVADAAFSKFAVGGPALVLPNPVTAARPAVFESLGH